VPECRVQVGGVLSVSFFLSPLVGTTMQRLFASYMS
jgi:hypothetical protein